MEKVAVRKKLQLRYHLPATLAALKNELEDLRLFASYYHLDADTLMPDAETCLLNRLNAFAKHASLTLDEVELAAVTEGAREPENEDEQWISNIQRAMGFFSYKADEKLSLEMLQEAHKMLVYKLPHAHQAGLLRVEGRNLFSFIEEGVLLPEFDELQDYLSQLFENVNNESKPAPIRAFLFYYIFTAIQPFAKENDTLAILAVYHILQREKMGLLGLLNLEKHIFFNDKFLVQTAHLFGEQNYLERLDADVSAYLEFSINRLRKALLEARETLVNAVKQEFEYDTLSSRQKNTINFWLEKGFFMSKEKLKTLTPRQHDILALAVRYSFISTKDLVPVFQLDRKTIQRDFNTLQELGLLEQRGGGRNIRYHLDFKILY